MTCMRGSYYWTDGPRGRVLRLDYRREGKRQRPIFARAVLGTVPERRMLEKQAAAELVRIDAEAGAGPGRAGLFDNQDVTFPTYGQLCLYYWERQEMMKEYIKNDPACRASEWAKVRIGMDHFGGITGDEIHREEVKGFRAWLRAGGDGTRRREWSAAYINRLVATVGRVFRCAITQEEYNYHTAGQIDRDRYGNVNACVRLENPVHGLPRLTEVPRRALVPTIEQAVKFVGLLPDPYRSMAVIALHTGMRRRNIVRLRWTEVDMVNGVIRPVSQKGGADPSPKRMHGEVVEVLRRAARTMHGEYVFPTMGGGTYQDFRRPWNAAAEAAGVPGLTMRDLRTTYVSWMAQAGAPALLVQRAVDHTTLATTTRIYNRVVSPMDDLVGMQRSVAGG